MAGRPSKYTPETVKKIITSLADGNTRRAACADGGISEDTFAAWLKNPDFSDFSDQVKKAEAKAEKEMVGIIRRAAKRSWFAAAWWLERRRPDDWGKREPEGEKTKPPKPPPPVVFKERDARKPGRNIPQPTSEQSVQQREKENTVRRGARRR